jgi:hypothetical protein
VTFASGGYSYLSWLCQQTGPTQATAAEAFGAEARKMPAIAAPTNKLFRIIYAP